MHLNRVIKIFKYFILSLTLLIVLVLTGINLPFSQRIITDKANGFFRNENLPVRVDKISLLVNGRIGLSGIQILNNTGDTVVFAQQVRVSVRVIPLLFRKVKVKTVIINDATVHITTDTISGLPDLVSMFSSGDKSPEKKEKSGKKWEIGVNGASLKNIRFTYNDIFHGIRIDQFIGKLNIGFDEFSLTTRKVYISYLGMENIHGVLDLITSEPTKDNSTSPPSAWEFKLIRSELIDILFTLHQPDLNQRMQFSIGRGEISDAGFDMTGRKILAENIMMLDPLINIYSSPAIKEKNPGSQKSSEDNFPGLWNIKGDKIEIQNGAFHTSAYNVEPGLNVDDGAFQVAALNTVLRIVRLDSQTAGFIMNRLSFALENGFELNRGEMAFSSDSTGKSMLQADLRTSSSKINLSIEAERELAALIRSWHAVPFSLKINDTKISASDIFALLPQLKEQSSMDVQSTFSLGLECNAEGTTELLELGKLNLNTSSGITFISSGQVANITKPLSAICSLAFRTGMITRSGTDELIKMTGSSVDLPDFEPMTFQGRIAGRLLAPEFMLNILGGSGNIAMQGSMDMENKSYTLKMAYSGLELGKLSGISDMDQVSGSVDLAGKEFMPDSMKIKVSVKVDSAVYRGYNYHDIHFKAEGEQGLYSFALNADDSLFKISLAGTADLTDTLTSGKISGLFDLNAGRLNLYKGASARGLIDAAADYSAGGINASVSLRDLVLSNDRGSEDLENITLSFRSSDTLIKGEIESDFLRADFSSAGSLNTITRIFKEGRFRIASIMDSAAGNGIPYISAMPVTSVSIESKYDPLIGLLLNDSIFSYQKVRADMIKDTTGYARAEVSVDRFNYGVSSGFGTSILIENLPEKSVILLKSDSIKYGKIKLTGLQSEISTAGDTAIYRLKASDKNNRLIYDMSGLVLKSQGQVKLRSTQSQWILNGYTWDVSPGDFLILDPGNNDLSADLHWKNDQRSIDIYGRKSGILNFECSNIGVKMLLIPGMDAFGYDGELTGTIDYQGNNKSNLGIRMDIRQMKMGEALLGDLLITGSYQSDTTGKKEGDIRVVMNDTSSFNFGLRYGKNEDQNSIRTDFSGIPLNVLEPLVNKYISRLQGEVNGGVSVTLKEKKPLLDGEIRISNTGLRVVPLNTLFYLPDDVIKLEKSQVVFNQFTILDSLKKKLILNGKIDLNDPYNILADLEVTSELLQVMNTTVKDNPAFYGSIFINSGLNITGPVQKPAIQGNIVLAKGTVINYKYMEDLTVSETQKVITFASLTQDQKSGDNKQVSVSPLSKSPDIEASIEIDPNSLFNFQITRGFDIGVSITGGGFLTYSLMPNREMDLTGTYEINQGSSELKIPGWPRKDFIITPGSFLKWDGKVDDPELQLETTSKVRGSYYNQVDSKNREVNFLVYMKLAGTLSQLEIIFDVRSEDQYITSVFNSLSKDERMRQAINLLIFGSIQLPNLASSSDYVTQQINQFWESQLNQITKSAIKKVDFSIGIDTYTGVSEGGAEQTYTSFSYEVKKEMFKDRGSILLSGHTNYDSPGSQQSNAVIENFIFEYALDTNRIKYLKVYRQQNYEDLLEGEVTKSGIGFIYRKNYDKISDIWRRQKKTKKK